jgi:hypothetical protein
MKSGGLEPVQDDGGGVNSVFAKYFPARLRDDESPALEGSKLFLQIRKPVMDNALQTPEYAPIRSTGHVGGDFIFLRRTVSND